MVPWFNLFVIANGNLDKDMPIDAQALLKSAQEFPAFFLSKEGGGGKSENVLCVCHSGCTSFLILIILTVAQQNHADEDCFVLVILTHGEPDRVYATDDLVNVDDLLTPLKTCPSLAGKPKIIIIQVRVSNWR